MTSTNSTQSDNTTHARECIALLHEITSQIVTRLIKDGKLSSGDRMQIAAMPLTTAELARAVGVSVEDLEVGKKTSMSTEALIVAMNSRVAHMAQELVAHGRLPNEFDMGVIHHTALALRESLVDSLYQVSADCTEDLMVLNDPELRPFFIKEVIADARAQGKRAFRILNHLGEELVTGTVNQEEETLCAH